MRRVLPGVVLAGLLIQAPFSGSGGAADQPGKEVLVGINYFAGWWEPLPNKRHDPVDGSDWRLKYPGRLPLLSEFNTQATMDKEIETAAAHGVDFFSILWYPIPLPITVLRCSKGTDPTG